MSMFKRIAASAIIGLSLSVGCANADNLAISPAQLGVRGNGPIDYAFKGGDIVMRLDTPAKDTALAITPPDGQSVWDFSRATYLVADIENLSKVRQSRLNMQINGVHAGKPRDVNVGVALNPGEKRTVRLVLPHEWKYTGPADVPAVRSIDTAKVSSITFLLQWPYESKAPELIHCRISNLRLEGEETPGAGPIVKDYIPFIDVYGQFMHADWPEKVKSAEDLRRAYEAEKSQLASTPRPTQWNQYGGWKNGPQLKATGSFRTQKFEGKWYLVDPEGRLFFSHGLDVLSAYNDPLKVLPGKENWFADIPAGTTRYFPTEIALRQKYGTEEYRPEYFSTLAKRLEAWGMNSIGDWSRAELCDLGKTPYTLQLTDYDAKLPRVAGSKLKFYDVFDPAYAERMKNLFASSMERDPIYKKSIDDPMCIGYFIDNELNFGNRGARQTWVDDVVRAPAKQAAKREFMNDVKAKYNSIDKLNTAWQTRYASWDEMLAGTTLPNTPEYRDDADALFRKALDRYFMLARDAVKATAPNRLYLGCRFISTDAPIPDLYNACAKYADVLSVNIYSFTPANFPSETYPDIPVLIGEFQFGILQRGMFNASLCQAGATPDDRAHAYTRFMQGALLHPNIVGAHYFQYRDQPLTGRGDSEAYQIGFVDVVDMPYPEMTAAARRVGEQMYEYRRRGKPVEFAK